MANDPIRACGRDARHGPHLWMSGRKRQYCPGAGQILKGLCTRLDEHGPHWGSAPGGTWECPGFEPPRVLTPELEASIRADERRIIADELVAFLREHQHAGALIRYPSAAQVVLHAYPYLSMPDDGSELPADG